jgi:hypothetical protein
MANLIGPDGLEPDAVVPQCLDNQYLSDTVFTDMIRRGVDYEDGSVAAARERDFRNEFVRSLIYSSQVVVQRAYLRNSDFLYKNYEPTIDNRKNLRAFADLIRQQAIVPYLFAESSLSDRLEFDVRKEGDAATRALLDEVGDDVVCVRLAVNDDANAEATARLATDFGTGLTRLNNLRSGQRNAMASELFADRGQLDRAGMWQAFEDDLDTLADYSYRKSKELRRQDKNITRQDVYQDCFAAGDHDASRHRNVTLGRFKPPGQHDPYLLELKKYVDLVYNTNLPDHLKRYTFTPANMPSRMALQDAPGTNFRKEDIRPVVSNPEVLEWIRRSFVARTQSAMSLPLLRDLTIADVLAVRKLPEWEIFKDAQASILRDPLNCLDNLPAFQLAFDQFQRALSDWHNITYQHDRTVDRYCNFVSLLLSIGGLTIVAGSHLASIPHDLAAVAIPAVAERIPRRVKGYAAKLMVGVYDVGRRQLDADRAYTIELMQTNEELLREEVVDLLRAVTDSSEATMPSASGLVADQGIQ